MRLDELRRTIRNLVTVEPTGAPVISCYVDLGAGRRWRDTLDGRVRAVRRSLPRAARRDFEEALGRVESWLASPPGDAKGAAIFARAGDTPLFAAMPFHVPLPTWFSVGPTPNVYHLVELKDTYHRYVVVITTPHEARIVEVNLGAVTEQIWRERPAEPERVRERWSREHYRHHREGQTEEFVREKIRVVDSLMRQGGHTHLIVAGDEQMVARVCDALPRHLQAKLVDAVLASPDAPTEDVVLATLATFVRAEELESRALVDSLCREIETGGLGEAGAAETLLALRWAQADALVIAKAWKPDPAWRCAACRSLDLGAPPPACPECGARGPVSADLREEFVRLAERSGCPVEIVNESPALLELGGVGCLLRYRVLPEEAGVPA